MKIITLNTWGGRAGKEGLLEFFKNHKDDTDIFCLQEIWSAPYEHLEGTNAGGIPIDNSQVMVYGLQEISKLLPDHITYFRPHHLDNYGLLMLVHKNITVDEEGEVFVYKERGFVQEGDIGNHARNIQYITTTHNDIPTTIVNFHGLWNGQGKTDTDDRILQSKNILNFINGRAGNIILCGDFNLLPTTESLQMFEQAGYRDLVKEFGITSTRTSHYTKPEKFADYIFTSKNVEVKEFTVLPDEVSDHSPLLLKI